MSRKLLFAICLSVTAMTLTAQHAVQARVEQIRKAYADRLTLMQNQPYDDDEQKVERMTVSYNRMIPGTGFATYKDTYCWTDDNDENYMLKPTLYFVTSSLTMNSGLYSFYREYLFDAQTEEPMFMLVTTEFVGGGKRLEYRFYFDKGKLIKQIPEKIGPVGENELTPGIEVDKNGKAVVAGLLKEFESLKTTFHSIVETWKW